MSANGLPSYANTESSSLDKAAALPTVNGTALLHPFAPTLVTDNAKPPRDLGAGAPCKV